MLYIIASQITQINLLTFGLIYYVIVLLIRKKTYFKN